MGEKPGCQPDFLASMAAIMAWSSKRDNTHPAFRQRKMWYSLDSPGTAGRNPDDPELQSSLKQVVGKQTILILRRKTSEPSLVSLLPASPQRESNRGFRTMVYSAEY